MKWMSYAVAALLLSACGDDDAEDGAVDYPECTVAEQLVLEGTLDGQPVSVRKDVSGHIFVNVTSSGPGRLDLLEAAQDGTSGSTRLGRLEFEKTLVYGGQVSVRGVIELTGEGVIAGNCENDGLPGLIAQNKEGDTLSFVLRGLKSQPYCGAAARSGELRGCIKFDRH